MNEIKVKYNEMLPEGYTGIILFSNGDKFWYFNGNLHREDGPAIEYADGAKEWCINGKPHRLDGPACEWSNRYKEYYIDGKFCEIEPTDLNEFIILDEYIGKYELTWYKAIHEDGVIREIPDIPGLIIK